MEIGPDEVSFNTRRVVLLVEMVNEMRKRRESVMMARNSSGGKRETTLIDG